MSLQKNRKTFEVKGVLFDVDGTLYHQAPLRLIMIVLLILRNALRPLELRRKIRVIREHRRSQEVLRREPATGGGNRTRQLALTGRATGETVGYVGSVVEEWFERRPIPFLRICRRGKLNRTFEILHKKGIRLGVFSDYPAERKLKALGISRFLTTVLSSYDDRVYGFKPMSNGFEIAAADMGYKCADILYVGDRPEVDGVGASEAGMQVMILRGILKRRDRCEYPSVRCLKELLELLEVVG